MIAPTIAVEIRMYEAGHTVSGEYRVEPSKTLDDLFDHFALQYPRVGWKDEWRFSLNERSLRWGTTVGEVARLAGNPAVLVLGLRRAATDRQKGEGADGDEVEFEFSLDSDPADEVDWDALKALSKNASEQAEGAGGDWDRTADDDLDCWLEEEVTAPQSPAKPAPPRSRAVAPGAPPAPAPATRPPLPSEPRKERADTSVLRDEMPARKRAVEAEEDVDEDLADGSGELQKRVSRQATVRYYHRMNPQRVYPFLVVLSAEEIAEIAQKGVKQAAGDQFTAGTESPVEIEPVLPGCQCYPPRHTLVIGPQTQTLEFWVVPQVLGTIRGAKVIVRQDGDTLSEVKLEAKVVKQTAAVIVGILSFIMPYVTKGLKSEDPDGTKVQTALNWVANNLRPEMIFVGLALVAVGLYFWARPRKRDQFWDVTPKG